MDGVPPRFDKADKYERTVSHDRQLHARPAKTSRQADRKLSSLSVRESGGRPAPESSPRLRLRRKRCGRWSPRGEAGQQRTRRASWRQLSADEIADQREGLVGVRARLPRETVTRAREVDAL